MADFRNPCGGTRWADLPDGAIEIEGRGVELLDPANEKYARQSWANFAPEIQAASGRRGVPVPWILALMTAETGLWSSSREKQAATKACVGSSCYVGPMAVGLSNYHYGGYSSPDDMYDPEKNIDTGAAIVASYMKQGHDLPEITSLYNCGPQHGPCRPNAPDTPAYQGGMQRNEFLLCGAAMGGIPYPLFVIRANNTAVRVLGLGPAPAGGLGPWIFAAGAAVLAYALWTRRDSIAAVF